MVRLVNADINLRTLGNHRKILSRGVTVKCVFYADSLADVWKMDLRADSLEDRATG